MYQKKGKRNTRKRNNSLSPIAFINLIMTKVDQRMSSKKKTLLKYIVGAAALTGLANVANDHAMFKHTLRKLCETNEDEANDLIEQPRGLASSIVQYIDEALNGEELTCDMLAPPVINPALAYPPLT